MRTIHAALIFAVIGLFCPSAALGGLIVNGDFEANFAPQYFGFIQVGGPIDGWTLSGAPGEICWGQACFGLRQSAAQLETFGSSRGVAAWFGDESNFIAQQIPTTPGASYVLSAWLMNCPGEPPNQFEFWWDGTLVGSLTDAAGFSWTQFSYFVTATGASTEVKLGGSNLPALWALDGVDVNPTPEPSSMLLCAAALAALAASGFRRVAVRRHSI